MKERTVAIVGLGYVGLPIAVAFGKHGACVGCASIEPGLCEAFPRN